MTQTLEGVLRPKQAAAFLGVGKTTFYRWVAEGRLPKGIQLEHTIKVWRKTDLDDFLTAAENVPQRKAPKVEPVAWV
jgi:predicted DNA-binding transcriptional regulator AlpA